MDNNWLEVVANPMLLILGQKGADTQMPVKIFKAFVQAILLFGSETWVVTPHIVRTLGGFHNWVAHSLTGKNPQWHPDVRCIYQPLIEDLEATILSLVEECTTRCHNTVSQYTTPWLVLDTCMGTERMVVSGLPMRWR